MGWLVWDGMVGSGCNGEGRVEIATAGEEWVRLSRKKIIERGFGGKQSNSKLNKV